MQRPRTKYTPGQIVGYTVDKNGNIGQVAAPERNGGSGDRRLGYQASGPSVDDFLSRKEKSYPDIASATNAAQKIISKKSEEAATADYNKKIAEVTSQENAKTAAAQQIAALAGTGLQNNLQAANLQASGTPTLNAVAGTSSAVAGGIQQLAQARTDPALLALSAERNYGASPLAAKLNFQVSDDQILNDYNTAKVDRYKRVVDVGNTQTVGIQERLTAAEKLLATLPANSAQRTASDVYVDGLKKDLASVRSAVSDATSQIKNFKPLAVGSTEAAKEITSFRSFLQLPEERASQQLRQIDPESYDTSVQLGRQYRELAGQPIGQTQNAQTEAFRAQLEKGYRDYSGSPIGATTTPETEALRKRIEGEAMSQLALGSQLGAEEQRAYQQAARGAQSARGNIFGVAPAVEEAVTTGAAGEQRKLARYGAASQFLSSGETTGAALARDVQLRNALQQSKLGAGGQFLTSGQTMSDAMRGDIAFRDALQQNRMGAAANFVAGGPSIYNLTNQRTTGQQGAMQQYIQANQALPGQFGQQPSTASNFYQTVDPGIPVALQNAFASLYGSQANYLSNTYGAQVGAISRQPNAFQNFATAAGGFKDLAGGFGGLASAGILCWVAREVYGIDNPKWLQFREWMLTKASDNLRNYYIEYGERIAKSIRNRPKIKALIRKWMDSKIG